MSKLTGKKKHKYKQANTAIKWNSQQPDRESRKNEGSQESVREGRKVKGRD